jgi:hypothetical protein
VGRGKTSGVELDATVFHVWTFRDALPWQCKIYFDEESALEAGGLRE